jgi:hypothetical protein
MRPSPLISRRSHNFNTYWHALPTETRMLDAPASLQMLVSHIASLCRIPLYPRKDFSGPARQKIRAHRLLHQPQQSSALQYAVAQRRKTKRIAEIVPDLLRMLAHEGAILFFHRFRNLSPRV